MASNGGFVRSGKKAGWTHVTGSGTTIPSVDAMSCAETTGMNGEVSNSEIPTVKMLDPEFLQLPSFIASKRHIPTKHIDLLDFKLLSIKGFMKKR